MVSHIVFENGAKVFVVDLEGTNLREIGPQVKDLDRYQEQDRAPSVSPDGSRVAFATHKYPAWIIPLPDWLAGRIGRNNFEIMTSALDGSDARRLTESWHLDTSPVWSPDGSRIAFVSARAEGRNEIYTMAADGSDARRIAPSVYAYSYPVWSPDGRRIAFVSRDFYLYVVGADGSDLTEIAETRSQPTWSPDGRRITFVKPEGSKNHIYTTDPDGSNAQRVSPTEINLTWVQTMSWSPDGNEILYVGGDKFHGPGYRPIARTLNVDTGEIRQVIDSYSAASWSPDGSRIAMSLYVRVRSFPGPIDSIVTIARDGSDARVLARDVATGTSSNDPQWRLEPAYGVPLSTLRQSTPPLTTSPATPAPAQSNSPSLPVTPPCEGGASKSACDAREVDDFTLFSANHSGAAHGSQEDHGVEDILERGLQLAGASPVHLALRGSGQRDSARCEWRGVVLRRRGPLLEQEPPYRLAVSLVQEPSRQQYPAHAQEGGYPIALIQRERVEQE